MSVEIGMQKAYEMMAEITTISSDKGADNRTHKEAQNRRR